MNDTLGTCLALSVAALFATSCDKQDTGSSASGEASKSTDNGTITSMPALEQGKVQCLGIHECKGKSACHVIGAHACAGQNECKGKGWIQVPAAECEAKGGKVLDS